METKKLILAADFEVGFPQIKVLLEQHARLKKAVFIPTAAMVEEWEPVDELHVKPLEAMGMRVTTFDLAGKSSAEVRAAMADVDVIYVSGGNTFYLLEQMRSCDFKTILQERLAAGVVYVGSSAGAIVCCPDIAFITPMEDVTKANLTNTEGMALVDFLLVPHLNNPYFNEEAAYITQHYNGERSLLALLDEQVLWVEGSVIKIL